jgi:catechol 2,3-dioxygenase-like lactoylglutathione lyase family enzyme
VKDVDRSTDFYSRLLDLHVRWSGILDGGRKGAHVGDDRSYLALFEAAEATPITYDYTAPGINHFGFVVDDLEAARARLAELGADGVTDTMAYEPGRRLYFLDPDGQEVELVEY